MSHPAFSHAKLIVDDGEEIHSYRFNIKHRVIEDCSKVLEQFPQVDKAYLHILDTDGNHVGVYTDEEIYPAIRLNPEPRYATDDSPI